jgi:hypothetical protein
VNRALRSAVVGAVVGFGLFGSGFQAPADARIGLVTVPRRDAVQATIYNSADLTLVRERRALTLAAGHNRLEFSWAGTLIDPTSVQFEAKSHADKVEVIDVSFPAQAPNALVWTVESEVAGEVVIEISYFTSGMTWEADYEMVTEPGGEKAKVASFVKVSNRSGEEYENAQVRLVVGNIHLVENIAELARRGGRPISATLQRAARARMAPAAPAAMAAGIYAMDSSFSEEAEAAPEIVREGLSEYFIYTVGGTHAVPDGWSVRWPNFSVEGIDVENFYRYEEGRYNEPRRFLRLRNDKPHKLGEEPLPDGQIVVYAARADRTRLFLGRSRSKYVPIGESWEIDLGNDRDVIVEPNLMRWSTDNFEFNNEGNPSGWDRFETWNLEVVNSRPHAITIEIDRRFTGDFSLKGVSGSEMLEAYKARFTRTLAPRMKLAIEYEVTTRTGTRARR